MEAETANNFQPLLNLIFQALGEVLREDLSAADLAEIHQQALKAYSQQVPELPDIGDDNPWLKSLISVAFLSEVWERLEQRGWTIEKISVTTQRALGILSRGFFPPEKFAAVRDAVCSPAMYRAIAERSQKRRYADDWLCQAVEPQPGDDFTAGIDVYHCPIKTLLNRLQRQRFFPYFCLDDYVMHAAIGVHLTRTGTLSHGAPCCSFRVKPVDAPFDCIIEHPETLTEWQHE